MEIKKSHDQRSKETEGRERLRREKPKVLAKILQYEKKHAQGEYTPILEFIYDYTCNMHCKHCCNAKYEKREHALTPEDVKMVADQADDLGLAQISISGGEPLLFDDFDEVVKAIGPDRFHISLSTNGFFLTEERARHLKKIGIDKVKISIDSIDEKVYETGDMHSGGLNRALEALFNAKKAGLQVNVSTVITHQNCRTPATEKLAKYCQENGFNVDVMIARAIGNWEGREDVLIDEADAQYLIDLHQKYPVWHRDTFPTYEETEGFCGAVKKIIAVTKYGDVLPCVFIHIGLGNIYKESLKDIMDRALTIKYFSEHNPKCLSGEDRCFIKDYMSKFYTKPLPVDYKEIFSNKDFIKKEDQ